MTKPKMNVKTNKERPDLKRKRSNVMNKRKCLQSLANQLQDIELCDANDITPESICTSSSKPSEYLPDLPKKLVAIKYPGMVSNMDKVLETLGGLKSIAIAAGATENRRLELRFRPEDLYCKPCCGDRDSTPGILLKVKVRRIIPDMSAPSCSQTVVEPIKETYETTVVGVNNFCYKFNSLCDYQYLPMDLKNAGETYPGTLECIYNKLVPDKLPDITWLLEGEAAESKDKLPLHLPPPIFNRYDTSFTLIGKENSSINKSSTDKSNKTPNANKTDLDRLLEGAENQPEEESDPSIIKPSRLRKRRLCYGIAAHFKDDSTPQGPNAYSLKILKIKFLNEYYESVDKAFQERPVWSKTALRCKTKLTKDQLKFLLPAAAYYFRNGPWRCMWIRFGYDPRKTYSARIYQTFDFRVRSREGVDLHIKAKRPYSGSNLSPYKNKHKSNISLLNRLTLHTSPDKAKRKDEEKYDENLYVFRPGIMPPSRQVFYQYCDLLVPEIQAMIARLPDALPDAVCHEKNGWLPSGFDDQCREILFKYCAQTVRSKLKEEQENKLNTAAEEMDSTLDEGDSESDEDFDDDANEDDEFVDSILITSDDENDEIDGDEEDTDLLDVPSEVTVDKNSDDKL